MDACILPLSLRGVEGDRPPMRDGWARDSACLEGGMEGDGRGGDMRGGGNK